MADWTIPADLPAGVRSWWAAIIEQLRETERLNGAQPIHVRLLAQSLYQYDWITEEINTRSTQIDELYNESTVKRQVSPEVRAQAELLEQIRRLLKDLHLDSLAADAGDPLESLRRRVEQRAHEVRCNSN